MRALVIVVVVTASVTGCAGRFQGEIDGAPVPPFSSAALGVQVLDGGQVLTVGVAMPGDSCVEGATFAQLQRDLANGETPSDRVDARAALAAWHQRVLPAGQWLLRAGFFGDSEVVMRDAVIDVASPDTDVDVSFELCKSGGQARVEAGALIDDLECYRVSEGLLSVDLADDRSSLRALAEEPVSFTQSGQQEGALKLDVSFAACPALNDGLPSGEDQPQPIPGDCFEQCFDQPDGTKICEVVCPDAGGGAVRPDGSTP